MTRRPGFTIVEILVAMFILAIGVIAIQTMFPLAAQQMATAVREDRSALSAFTSDAYIRSYWRSDPTNLLPFEPFWQALDNPDSNTAAPHGLVSAAADPISYPVVVDPMGYAARAVGARDWLGDFAGTNVPRRTLNVVLTQPPAAQAPYALRICSLMDGLGYDEFGGPVDPNSGLVNREFRYNWLWIVQRTSNANKFTANLTVVVFDKRAHLFAPAGAEAVFNGVALDPNPASPNNTRITLPGSPDVKAGGWVMDATVQNAAGGIRHANLYRVVRAADNGMGGMDVDLETPIRRTDGQPFAYAGTVVVLRGVSGVYTRPPLTIGE